jgi:DKNYY family
MARSGRSKLEQLGEDYSRDDTNVFFRGKIIAGAHAPTFRPLNYAWATDRNGPYRDGRSVGLTDGWSNRDMHILFNAHPELDDYWFVAHPRLRAERHLREGGWCGAIELIGHGFAEVDGLAFINGIPLFDIDVSRLRVYSERLYQDDGGVYDSLVAATTIYFDGRPSPRQARAVASRRVNFVPSADADPATFELLYANQGGNPNDIGYARDRSGIYWCFGYQENAPIRTAADRDSFRVVTRRVGVDKSQVFYAGRIVEHARPDELDTLGVDSIYFRSGAMIFAHGKVMKTPKVDVASFAVITNELAADRNRVYGDCERQNRVIIKNVAPSDLALTQDGGVLYRDKTYRADAIAALLAKYAGDAFDHLDEITETGDGGKHWTQWIDHRIEDGAVCYGPLTLEDADPKSFRLIGRGYARDDHSLWFGHDMLATMRKSTKD